MSYKNYIIIFVLIFLILKLYINSISKLKYLKLESESRHGLTRYSFNNTEIKNKYILILNILDYQLLNNKLGIDSGNDNIIKEYSKYLHANLINSTIYRLHDDTFAIVFSKKYKSLININVDFKYHDSHIKPQRVLFYKNNLKEKSSFYEKLNYIRHNSDYAKMIEINAYDINHKLEKEILFNKEILLAIENREFKAHFQPILSNDGKKIIAIEALTRWYKKNGEVLTPFFYLDTISNLGLSYEIDISTLKEADKFYNQLIKNSKTLLSDLQINVNISPQTLLKIDLLLENLTKINIPYENLTFEILEDTEINSETINTMNRLSSLGINISIDDFGSGFMSLQYLKLDIVKQVKIDKSLLPFNIISDRKAQKTLKNTFDILKIHNKQIIIEGVESESHFDYLSKNFNQKTELQGFYFSKPIPNHELIKLIEKNKWLT